ncbi:hypothetical protein [Rathayibacter soli]|uniref:hypothetical protein n=1 Tax=Rathayibacter soli TaxID=3144168 RepID=UPI0027E3F1FC|nr:hypothetical protein [Glaciibacter superstes]
MFSVPRFGRGAQRRHRTGVPGTGHLQHTTHLQRTTRSALLTTVVASLAAIGVALSATAGSYALWNGAATVGGATVTAGASAVTINGATTASLPALGALGPGESVATPLTIANTGSTPLTLAVTGTTIGADAGSLTLAPALTATLTQVPDAPHCVTGLTGGTTGALNGFTTTASPVSLAKGANAVLCLQLTLATAAPSATQGKSATFTMALTGTQVQP